MTSLVYTSDPIVADAYFPVLRDHIVSATGLMFYADRPDALAGHICSRLRKRGLTDCREYWDLLHDGAAGDAELDALVELLSIGETYFFRHQELFNALREVALPEIIERNRATRRLRVWSAGCSTGPEAYSVSVLLRRDLATWVEGWKISILGTDINRPFLSQAAEGRYEEWAFRGTSAELRRECFEEEGKAWRIAQRFQDGVTFQYHNLARHPFPSLVHNLAAFDLIFCRNVLIYFAPEIVERIVSQLTECLVPGGWLAIGHAEHGAKCLGALESVNREGATLYQKARSQVDYSVVCSLGKQESSRGACGQHYRMTPVDERPARRTSCKPNAPDRASSIDESIAEIDKVRELADRGDIEAALQLCDSLIAANPRHASFYFYRALLLDQTAGHEAALKALNRAIYLDRELVLAHYYLGTTLLKLSNAAGATKSFRNVRQLVAGRDPAERLPDAEGMTIADLDELTRSHLEMLDET